VHFVPAETKIFSTCDISAYVQQRSRGQVAIPAHVSPRRFRIEHWY